MMDHRLILVRHGETVGNSSIRYYGRTDLELSELGRAQMEAAARWLETRFGANNFAPVFSSPLHRAIESARLIAGLATAPREIAEFVEVDFGLFESLTADEIRDRYPAEFERWNRDRLDAGYTYPSGENRAAFTARVERGVERMLTILDRVGSAPQRALVVAHRGVIRAMVRRLAGAEPHIELGSIHVLRRDGQQLPWRADALDVTEHLESLE
jgi:broad specificity phosphatase PhoE